MSVPAVEESWARIDAWLARHAPLTPATLRPPAPQAVIEEAERTLGVPFHPDLVASLRCHDGVEPDDATAQLTSYQLSSRQVVVLRAAVRCRGHRAEHDLPPEPRGG
jgi:cell wall assembly regulator SMI1